MARIRSIKPEFPQSETIGRLSRDARLLFIQLWTVVDDSGRTRAASRMLASLLYPYDDDAPKLIDGWLAELEDEGCIRRYVVDDSQYLDIPNWLKHQKIDKPSVSKIPEFVEHSTISREGSRGLATDLGPRTLEQDQGPSSLRSDETRETALAVRQPDAEPPVASDDFPELPAILERRAKAAVDLTRELNAEFDERFWPAYPHKVGKPDAQKAFRRARKAHPLAVILSGLDRYVAEKPPDRPWLNPATFLNQERFNDQPASTENRTPASPHDALLGAVARQFAPRDDPDRGQAGAGGGLFDEPGDDPGNRGGTVELGQGDYRRTA